jgi:hypothetical protein
VRHNSAIPTANFNDVPASLDAERVELNSVASVTSVAIKNIDTSSLVVTPNQCDPQNIQIKLRNSICESGLVLDHVSANYDGYIDANYRNEEPVTTETDSHFIGNVSNFERISNHTTVTEHPIKNIRSFLSLKPKTNEKYNKIKTRTTLPKHNNASEQKSEESSCPNNTIYRELFRTRSIDGASSSSRGCKTVGPKKVNIILPPTARSETSSVNSSRESLARIQSITLQNEKLSFHYDLENFSHIDETDNEEELL